MSTLIIECEQPTWLSAGFAELDAKHTRQRCQSIFADTLADAELLDHHSFWRQFPKLWNRRWWHRNRVLIGDALHTAHFSIGSGTRLALEDAIALARALDTHPKLDNALHAYQNTRLPIVKKMVDAANRSAQWYETFGERMDLEPLAFAYDYITRSGRMDLSRLAAVAPDFAARYQQAYPS